MAWRVSDAANVSPGQRIFVASPGGPRPIYRVGIRLFGRPAFQYRRFGYLSLYYGLDIPGVFTYATLHPVGSVWEPDVMYELPRPVTTNGFVFHRARDDIGSYQIRFVLNDTD